MRRTVLITAGLVGLGVAITLMPGPARAQEPAEDDDPALNFQSYAAADDYLYTRALMCFVERCGGQIGGNPTQGAEDGWNQLRAAGYYAEELLDVACGADYGCSELFGPTLQAGVTRAGDRPLAIPYAPGGEVAQEPPPPPDTELPHPPAEYTERDPTLFFRPTVQVGIGLDGWILPHQGRSARAFDLRASAGWLFDVFMARVVVNGAIGVDEDEIGFSSASVTGQLGPMFREGESRLYIALLAGGGWAEFDGTPLRSEIGGLEFGALLGFRRVGLMGAYAGFEVHNQHGNGTPEWSDSAYIVREPTPGVKFYAGIQFGL